MDLDTPDVEAVRSVSGGSWVGRELDPPSPFSPEDSVSPTNGRWGLFLYTGLGTQGPTSPRPPVCFSVYP